MLWGGMGEGWRSDWTPDLRLSEFLTFYEFYELLVLPGEWTLAREGAVRGGFGNFSGYLLEAPLKEPTGNGRELAYFPASG